MKKKSKKRSNSEDRNDLKIGTLKKHKVILRSKAVTENENYTTKERVAMKLE